MDVAYAKIECPAGCGEHYYVPFEPVIHMGRRNASPRVVHIGPWQDIPPGSIPDYLLDRMTDHQRRKHAA